MGRVSAIIGGILVLAVLAGGLAEATLAVGHRGGIVDDTMLRPKESASPSVSPSATPTPSPTATPSVAPTPVPTPAFKTATTSSFVHMRSGKSTSTAIVYDLNGGTVVRLLPDSDAQWQQVQYNGANGYIFKTYLLY